MIFDGCQRSNHVVAVVWPQLPGSQINGAIHNVEQPGVEVHFAEVSPQKRARECKGGSNLCACSRTWSA